MVKRFKHTTYNTRCSTLHIHIYCFNKYKCVPIVNLITSFWANQNASLNNVCKIMRMYGICLFYFVHYRNIYNVCVYYCEDCLSCCVRTDCRGEWVICSTNSNFRSPLSTLDQSEYEQQFTGVINEITGAVQYINGWNRFCFFFSCPLDILRMSTEIQINPNFLRVKLHVRLQFRTFDDGISTYHSWWQTW